MGKNLCLADKKVCANFEIPRPISEIISNVGCGHTYMVTQLNYIVLSTGYAIMLLITDNVLKENLKDTTSQYLLLMPMVLIKNNLDACITVLK